jgi:hypothetical protein
VSKCIIIIITTTTTTTTTTTIDPNMGTNCVELKTICHLLCLDDTKVIRRSEEELRHEIRIVKVISNDIKMEFGLENCVRNSIISRGEVPGRRKPVIRDYDYDNDDNNKGDHIDIINLMAIMAC